MAIDRTTDVQSAKLAKRASQKQAGNARDKNTLPVVSVTRSNLNGGPFDVETRRELIAEAAYYLAAQRGFEPGRELEDWFAAEKEIDARLYGETHAF